MAATIRWLLVILPSLIGTLKSTLKKLKRKIFSLSIAKTGQFKIYRIRTRFPAKSKFSMLSLLRAIVIKWNERLIVGL
jgi:hypothetical protein